MKINTITPLMLRYYNELCSLQVRINNKVSKIFVFGVF
jgi:hypothetical protein